MLPSVNIVPLQSIKPSGTICIALCSVSVQTPNLGKLVAPTIETGFLIMGASYFPWFESEPFD